MTAIDLDDYRIVVLALTGPPAAGKSTAVGMLRDMDIPCRDTGEAIREQARAQYADPTEDQIWEVAELIRDEHGPAGPTKVTEGWIGSQRMDGNEVICISSLREQAEVEWLRENVGPTLVASIEADSHARSERYIDMKLDDDEHRDAIPHERVHELRDQLYERELREMPYPDHDVTIRNEDSVSMHELWNRLDNLVTVLDA
jgi:cytidylate kinase